MDMAENDSLQNMTFLTTAEVSQLLKMNPQVVMRKLQAGEIPGYKIGKDWRVESGQLKAWLESKSNQHLPNTREKIVKNFFHNGRLTHLPAARLKKRYILEEFLRRFERGRVYTEKDVNDVIAESYDDFCTIRREFIAEKMMNRKDGKYRVASSYQYLKP
jgi:excisionase family DNA binding protein